MQTAVIEKLVCPYCGGRSTLYVSCSDIHLKTTTEIFYNYRCVDCRLVFLANPPTDLGKFYPYTYRYRPSTVDELLQVAKQDQYKLDMLLRYKTRGKLLDVGSSNGAFCMLAKQAGFESSAIEMDGGSVEFLNSVAGVLAYQTDDPEKTLMTNDETYDVISFWHSLEHFRKPWSTLRAAAERLTSRGILIVAVPNYECLQARILGPNWIHYDLPRHLYGMPPSWIRRVLSESGLSETFLTFADAGSCAYTKLGWTFYAVQLSKFPAVRSSFRRLGSLFARFVGPLERVTANSAAYTIVFSRPN